MSQNGSGERRVQHGGIGNWHGIGWNGKLLIHPTSGPGFLSAGFAWSATSRAPERCG